MLHDHSRNRTYDAVLAGKYDNIRLFEMGKNKLRDGSWAATGNDHFIIPPPPPPGGGQLTDGDLSGWMLPSAGMYASASCRTGAGPSPKDPHTPCPDCCCTGGWQSHDWPNHTTTYTFIQVTPHCRSRPCLALPCRL